MPGNEVAPGVVVDLDRAARADLGAVGTERVEVDRLADGEDHGVGVEHSTVVVVEHRGEPVGRRRTPR